MSQERALPAHSGPFRLGFVSFLFCFHLQMPIDSRETEHSQCHPVQCCHSFWASSPFHFYTNQYQNEATQYLSLECPARLLLLSSLSVTFCLLLFRHAKLFCLQVTTILKPLGLPASSLSPSPWRSYCMTLASQPGPELGCIILVVLPCQLSHTLFPAAISSQEKNCVS
jgi:hypothetical protein